jgi:hypothetical protein
VNANLRLADQFAIGTVLTVLVGLGGVFLLEKIFHPYRNPRHLFTSGDWPMMFGALIVILTALLTPVTICLAIAGCLELAFRHRRQQGQAESCPSPNGGPSTPTTLLGPKGPPSVS